MLSQEKLTRINELAKKKKEEGLTDLEAKEQSKLRSEYLETFRKSFKDQIENTKVIDPEGNDVTPDKLKEVQRRNHKRS
ncbi:hypothetical protein DOS68_03430 [Staphylococcus felis]|uniref:UPF0291 protein DOS76_03235 n=1 Tax=Staphylococcus felis TaxID=46127 RepID=A0A3E0IGS9_9STAP|nr:DUF896 domain-containing protein [Staphylococcus felis]MBH9579965.1 DUF896 domain-containing protein [Staphylococcus felis]MDM8327831.1 DUF896 domain-containing protein [Staphylococcus felis]MDQ7192624.1 DUF896 domain-containing protein [Staphylococcus felis]REH74927.1 hypothetical protein DOS60_10235 [Staphylococcus felis]REH80178.1 hypothetical protein DOS59_01990 [Staphylococcus felis]